MNANPESHKLGPIKVAALQATRVVAFETGLWLTQWRESFMPLSDVIDRYYRSDSEDFPRSISWQQLLVLFVAET